MNKKTVGVIVVILAVVFGIVYFVRNDIGGMLAKSKCPWAFSPIMAAEPYYTGPLLDAHLHLPTEIKTISDVAAKTGNPVSLWGSELPLGSELSLGYLKCLFDREGMYGAYGFHLFTKYYMDAEVNMAKKIEKKHKGMITHFLMPTIINDSINPDIDKIAQILDDNPGLFLGIGELKMYDGKEPDDPYVLGFIELAKKHNLIVMMHPFDHHKKGVEKIVRQYPKVTFLFHGIVEDIGPSGVKNNINWLDKLMTNNKNVYYSVDGGLQIYGWKRNHAGKVVLKEEMLPYLKAHFKKQLQTDLSYYKNIIEKYPDRFLRGTDRFYVTHLDQEVSALLDEYSRALIGQLSPSVQEKFAHINADVLLEK